MDRYCPVRTLGRGNFGIVSVVKSKQPPEEEFVLKQVDLSSLEEAGRKAALTECQVLADLSHPFIVGYRESFIEEIPATAAVPASSELCIVMEWCRGGDLAERIKKASKAKEPFPERLILSWFLQIALALKHVHQRNVLHRDLKTQNIFLSGENRCKIGDFGISKMLNSEEEMAKTVIGTPYYLSPEICEGLPYAKKSDVWSLGLILYELCTLKHAFDGHTLPALVLKILNGVYSPIASRYSTDLRQLIDCMLQQQPGKRPTISQILKLKFLQPRLLELYEEMPELRAFAETRAGAAFSKRITAIARQHRAEIGDVPADPWTGPKVESEDYNDEFDDEDDEEFLEDHRVQNSQNAAGVMKQAATDRTAAAVKSSSDWEEMADAEWNELFSALELDKGKANKNEKIPANQQTPNSPPALNSKARSQAISKPEAVRPANARRSLGPQAMPPPVAPAPRKSGNFAAPTPFSPSSGSAQKPPLAGRAALVSPRSDIKKKLDVAAVASRPAFASPASVRKRAVAVKSPESPSEPLPALVRTPKQTPPPVKRATPASSASKVRSPAAPTSPAPPAPAVEAPSPLQLLMLEHRDTHGQRAKEYKKERAAQKAAEKAAEKARIAEHQQRMKAIKKGGRKSLQPIMGAPMPGEPPMAEEEAEDGGADEAASPRDLTRTMVAQPPHRRSQSEAPKEDFASAAKAKKSRKSDVSENKKNPQTPKAPVEAVEEVGESDPLKLSQAARERRKAALELKAQRREEIRAFLGQFKGKAKKEKEIDVVILVKGKGEEENQQQPNAPSLPGSARNSPRGGPAKDPFNVVLVREENIEAPRPISESPPSSDSLSPPPPNNPASPLTPRELRLSMQIESTRSRCIILLGQDLFKRVYEYVKKIGSLEGELLESAAEQRALDLETVVRSWLRVDQLPALRLIQKLIYCEDLFDS